MSKLGNLGARLHRGEISYDFIGHRKLWYGIENGPFRDLTTTNTHIVTATIERRLGDNFKLTNGTRYISNVRDSTVTAPRALGDANNTVFANGSSGGIASAGYPVDLMTISPNWAAFRTSTDPL